MISSRADRTQRRTITKRLLPFLFNLPLLAEEPEPRLKIVSLLRSLLLLLRFHVVRLAGALPTLSIVALEPSLSQRVEWIFFGVLRPRKTRTVMG